MLYQDFINKQNEVYYSIKLQNKEVVSTGFLSPNQDILSSEGGYLIALRYPTEIVKLFTQLSEEITSLIPSLTYGEENIHTTITVLDKSKAFTPSKDILEKLNEVAVHSTQSHMLNIKIDFQDCLFNKDSVIVTGIPNSDFISLASEIVTYGTAKELLLRYPKMAHITLARFVQEGDREKIEKLIKLLRNFSFPKQVQPNVLVVGHFITNSVGFKIVNYSQIDL